MPLRNTSYLEGVIDKKFEFGGTPTIFSTGNECEEGSVAGDTQYSGIEWLARGEVPIERNSFLKKDNQINVVFMVPKDLLGGPHHRTVKQT